MRRTRTTMALAGTVLVAVILAASPALAAPPSNDTFSGAKVITVPFSETLDTTEATTDSDDGEANADCGAPATEASVWYSLTASSDGAVLVDVSDSNYSAGLFVVTGFFFVDGGLPCNVEASPWQATVFPDNGKFAGGRATVSVFIFACNQFICGEDSKEALIRLRRR